MGQGCRDGPGMQGWPRDAGMGQGCRDGPGM